MNETSSISGVVSSNSEDVAEQRQKRVTAVAWVVGIVGLGLSTAIMDNGTQMSLGAGFAVTAVAAMVTIISVTILKLN